jgi:hypothetical protein
MRRITLDQVLPGMQLEEPVKDLSGRVLLQKGSLITEKSVRILKTWGIVEVAVQEDEGSETLENVRALNDSPEFSKAAEEVASLFRHTDSGNDLVRELMRLSTNRKVKAQAAKEGRGDECS